MISDLDIAEYKINNFPFIFLGNISVLHFEAFNNFVYLDPKYSIHIYVAKNSNIVIYNCNFKQLQCLKIYFRNYSKMQLRKSLLFLSTKTVVLLNILIFNKTDDVWIHAFL